MSDPGIEPTPSDRAPGVLAQGRTDVQVAVVSMSARHPEGRDAEYLEWHTLDHRPEQHRLPGLRAGLRWVSTPACRAARAASEGDYDAVDHVVAYLFAEPVGAALDGFFALGAALREAGRMPLRLPPVELAGWELADRGAADGVLVGADVLPWRPMRGIYLLVERGQTAPPEDLQAVAGVAGAWSFVGSSTLHPRLAGVAGVTLTMCFLDDAPPAVAARLAARLARRWERGAITPLLAAPLEAVAPFAWERALP